jgi:hypothetical protein
VTDEPALLRLCDSPKCPGVGPDALSVSTTRGNLCASCWKRLGRPDCAATSPALPPILVAASRMTPEAMEALDAQAGV